MCMKIHNHVITLRWNPKYDFYMMPSIIFMGNFLRNILTFIFISFTPFKYQALIIGFQMVTEMGISQLFFLGDSKLIISQHLEQYDVRKGRFYPVFGLLFWNALWRFQM